MPYQTDERLKSYLDTNQLHREQMCRAILAIDQRYTEVCPRHPRGGRDKGRDIEAIYKENQLAFGAVGFINQANDSNEQKKTVNKKFLSDLKNAISANQALEAFVFFTNINFTLGEKESLISSAKSFKIHHCEIFDRERLRISLDSPDGFSIRFQYLDIPLSESEQASFFARWGDDIQQVISTGFKNIENGINRLLFLEESQNPLHHLIISFELKEKFQAEDIGHFRAFCLIHLKEVKNNILQIIFGSSDKPYRMSTDNKEYLDIMEPSGIQNGISSGQWEYHCNLDNSDSTLEDKGYIQVGSGSSIGQNLIEFITISYRKHSLIRISPTIALRDFDEAMFMPVLNKSLAEKIKSIHIYSD